MQLFLTSSSKVVVMPVPSLIQKCGLVFTFKCWQLWYLSWDAAVATLWMKWNKRNMEPSEWVGPGWGRAAHLGHLLPPHQHGWKHLFPCTSLVQHFTPSSVEGHSHALSSMKSSYSSQHTTIREAVYCCLLVANLEGSTGAAHRPPSHFQRDVLKEIPGFFTPVQV